MFRAGKVLWLLVLLMGLVAIGAWFAPMGATDRATDAPDGDLVAFGRSLTVDKDFRGDVQTMAGSLHLDAEVTGNVTVFGGDVTFGPSARVSGDLICLGGTIPVNAGALVEGTVYAPATMRTALAAASDDQTRRALSAPFSFFTVALKIALLIFWLVAAVILTLVTGSQIRVSATELKASPLFTFTLGLVALTSFVLTAVVLSYLIPFGVGVPVLAVLGAFAFATKVYGMIAVFHLVGGLLIGPRTPADLNKRRWLRGDVAFVVVGLLVLGALRMIPVVGNIIWVLASLFGVGVALATKFGRREPWFLAWRPAYSTRSQN
ncbi:MAG: polymer-forming cytoskeletal protein [Nitrospiraceae bacterium]